MNLKIDTQPEECTIYFTDVCNFSCEGCSRQTVGKPKHKEMDVETVEKILTAYPSIESFCIAGLGEPTIGKHFPEVVNYLLNKGKYVGIITNGTYPERLLQLEKSPSYISISLYGFNKNEYKEWTKVDAFEKVKQNYKTLKSRFGNVGFSYILNKENYKKLDDIIKVCDELKPSFLNLVNYLVYDSTDENELKKIISLKDVEIIKFIENRCNSRNYINVRPIYNDNDDDVFSCPSYERIINVDGQGNIGGCQRQITPSIEYGNFAFNDDPYNSVPMQMLRRGVNDGHYPHLNCKSCFGRFNQLSIREKVVRFTGTTKANIAIMILFHEKVEQTIECLKSFLPSGNNIYILNNGSTKESLYKLKEFSNNYSQIKIFNSEKNLGVGVGRNFLIEHTNEEWMFFVDNDIYVTNNEWFTEFLVFKASYPTIEVFIPKLFNLHENAFVVYQNLGIKDNHIASYKAKNGLLNNFPGGAAIIHRSLFQRLGTYDDQMFVGLEDFEFVLRGIINNSPVKAKLIDSIELIHDHRKITLEADKNAVKVRYDESLIQKSFDRMQKKYPDLNVRHEWHSWVREQKSTLIEFDKYDLSLLTEERNFGARSKSRNHVLKNNSTNAPELSNEESMVVQEVTKRNKFSKIYLFQEFENQNTIINLSQLGIELNCYNNFEHTQASVKVNFSDNAEVEELYSSFQEQEPVLIIIDHILEKLFDPCYLLKLTKTVLVKNNKSRLILFAKERQSFGIDYPQDESNYREWKLQELVLFLSSGGFTVENPKVLQSFHGTGISVELSINNKNYNQFLKDCGLPELSMHFLICSNEHGKAKLSGGIGSYVEEAQKLFPDKELGVFLLGKGDLLPEKNALLENRFLSVSNFFDQNTMHANNVAELLLKSIQVIQYLYVNLKTIEVQDVEGYGIRLVQGKKCELISRSIKIQICAHGNKIQMEKVFEEWLDPLDYETVYKEKITLENADRVIFPTKYMRNLYESAGYQISSDKSVDLRLPFTFKNFPLNKYEVIDTVIFYGKRITVKGYDVFAEIMGLLDIYGLIGMQIKKIIMIGPKFSEMQKINDYLNTYKNRIEVLELSTNREEAISTIEKYHSRALCILPYKSDNHPYSLLEIIQTGCSFVISNTGGVLEMIPGKYHSQLTSSLEARNFVRIIKELLSKHKNERYSLFSSLYHDVIKSQKHYNQEYVRQNKNYEVFNSALEKEKLKSTLIAVLSENNNLYNERLIDAIKNQVLLPNKLICLYKGEAIIEPIKNSLGKMNFSYELIKFENYNIARNELLQSIDTEAVAIVKKNDIPVNYFLSSLINFLSRNDDYSCVTSYLRISENLESTHDSSRVLKGKNPYGEWGMLNIDGENYYGIGSSCFSTRFMKSINGWESKDEDVDDLATFYKIRSNNGKIGVVCLPLVIRIGQNKLPKYKRNFAIEQCIANNYYGLDKFDSHRISGLLQSNSLGKIYSERGEIPELEKYLIAVQTLLVNQKILEAKELLDSINIKEFNNAPKEMQNKIKRIKSKTEEIIKKIGVRKENTGIAVNLNPVVSVIIPTYNRPEQLKEAINSVLNQSYKNYEIHVVNDAGNDVSNLINSISDDRIHYHRHKSNKGLAAARNTGIRNSKGEYIALLDDDDVFYNEHLEVAISELIKGKDAVYTDAVRFTYKKHKDEYNLISKSVPYSIDYNRNKLLMSNISPVNCFVFKKNLIEKCGLFNEQYEVLEDWEFWLKLSRVTDFYHIKKPTVQVTWKDDGTTMTSSKQKLFQTFREKIYSEYKEEIKRIPNQAEIIAEFQTIWENDKLNKPIVSVIVPTYKQLNYTKEFLESLYTYTKIPFELIVVVNDSEDGTKDYLQELSNKQSYLQIVVNSVNKGFPASINQGLKIATCGNYLIINNDVVVTDGWLEKLLDISNKDSQIGLVGPISNEVSGLQKDETAVYSSIEEMHKYASEISINNKNKIVHFPRIAFLCTLIKKEVIEKIGGLDERFSPGNYEDDDFCLRAQLAGYKTVIAKEVFIHHYGSKSFKADGVEVYNERLNINRSIFVNKWGVTPDEIWLGNKTIKEHQIIFPISKDLFKQFFDRAKVQIADKELDLAKESVSKAVEHFEEKHSSIISYTELLDLAANIYLAVNDLETAKVYFEKELEIDPRSSSACYGLGQVFYESEENEAAKTMFEWAVKNDPGHQTAIASLSEVNSILGLEATHNTLLLED